MFIEPQTTICDRLEQRVFLGSFRRSDIIALTVAQGANTEGSSATFSIPEASWDEPKRNLIGRFISVDVRYSSEKSFTRIFNGYVTSINSSTSQNSIEFTAESYIAISHRVYLGQKGWDFVVSYPFEYFYDGSKQKTGWNIPQILRDILGSSQPSWRHGGYGTGNIPSEWRARLRPGDLSVFQDYYNKVELGDIIWRQITLKEALDDLLGKVETVGFRERHVGIVTYLDFYEMGDTRRPTKNLHVTTCGNSIAGKNVFSVTKQEETSEVVTSITVLGKPKKYGVTLSQSNGGLIPAWNPEDEATALRLIDRTQGGYYRDLLNIETAEFEGLTEAEREVLINNKFTEILESSYVFRRFAINPDFFNYIFEETGVIELELEEEGEKQEVVLPIQAFYPNEVPVYAGVKFSVDFTTGTAEDDLERYTEGQLAELIRASDVDAETPVTDILNNPTLAADINYNGTWLAYTSTNNRNTAKLVQADLDLENLIVVFPEPVLKFRSTIIDRDGRYQTNYDRGDAHLTVYIQGERLSAEAEAGSLRLDGIEVYKEIIQNESFDYIQLTNVGRPVNEKTYPFICFVDGVGWKRTDEKLVVRDDTKLIGYFAAQALRERNTPTVSYSMSVPYFTNSYRVGDQVRLIGEKDFRGGGHTVTGVVWDLTRDHGTELTTSNARPQVYYNLLSGGAIE